MILSDGLTVPTPHAFFSQEAMVCHIPWQATCSPQEKSGTKIMLIKVGWTLSPGAGHVGPDLLQLLFGGNFCKGQRKALDKGRQRAGATPGAHEGLTS